MSWCVQKKGMSIHECEGRGHLHHYWAVMHASAAYLPEKPSKKERQVFWDFLRLIGKNLPCQDPCGHDWKRRLQVLEPNRHKLLATRSKAFQLIFDIHNIWNAALNKKLYLWEDAIAPFPNQNLMYDHYKGLSPIATSSPPPFCFPLSPPPPPPPPQEEECRSLKVEVFSV